MVFQIKAKVIKNIEVRKNYCKIILLSPQVSQAALPGQFVTAKINLRQGPLLRRPFSIHRIKKSYVEILYEVVGQGSKFLSQKKPGEYLDIIGPLGNGFSLQAQNLVPEAILVAGGMGVAPLIFLAERLMKINAQRSMYNVFVLIGAKTGNQILCENDFKKIGCDVKIATDDGSRGLKGKVTDLLKKFLLKRPPVRRITNSIYSCGPRPMLKEIATIAKRHNISAQVSLEEHMACGIGACLGCVTKTQKGYQRVCKEGPVFEAKEIIWSI